MLLKRFRPFQFYFLLGSYAFLLAASMYMAYELRFDFALSREIQQERLQVIFWSVPLKLSLLFAFGQFSGMLRYFGIPDFFRVLFALASATALIVVMFFLYEWFGDGRAGRIPSRMVISQDFTFSIIAICGFRLGLRMLHDRLQSNIDGAKRTRFRTLLVGADQVGASLAMELLTQRHLGYQPIGFLDRDESHVGRSIHGLPVLDTPEHLINVCQRLGIKHVIYTGSADSGDSEIQQIVKELQPAGIKLEILDRGPGLSARASLTHRWRPVELEDLLGRSEVNLDSEKIEALIKGKVVMVTGAGGSIGTELCRQISARNPDRLLMVDQSEVQLFVAEQAMIEEGGGGTVTPLVADILDEDRMRRIFRRYKPQLVFHAAAHKHVPMMERQPTEAIKNNTFGTAMVAKLASEYEVKRFILISTDKAINPTNVMGATKRLAEWMVQDAQRRPGNKTSFSAVRFGNVLGSSGSVIPTFKAQLAKGGPLTVTHRDVTRYFMTIPEAVGLVLQSATQDASGEVFILDMGRPIKIYDVACRLIELSGLRPEVDVEIRITGLRPGEKLYEELQDHRESMDPTEHPVILRLKGEPPSPEEIEEKIAKLKEILNSDSTTEMKKTIAEILPEYKPYLD